MLSGKRFLLKRETISIHTMGGERQVVMVPEGAIVEVISGPKPDDKRMVDILWDTKVLVMFAEDIQARGEEITGRSASAS
jgi:hypothetical protein